MKKTLFSIMFLLFVVLICHLPSGFAQDSIGQDWDLPEGAKVRIILSHDVIKHRTKKPFYESVNAVGGVVFSPDGQTLATGGGSMDAAISLWDVATGEHQKTLKAQQLLWCMSFSPDGKTIASGNLDNTIRLWNVETGKLKKILIGHTNYINGLAFIADGNTLVSLSGDDTILLWDLTSTANVVNRTE